MASKVRYESTRVHANMFGYRGVEWNQSRSKFRARIEPSNGRRGRWLGYFDTAEDAAVAYDNAARDVYGAAAFLNFPRLGEKKVVASPRAEGLCPNGHNLAEYGYHHARGINCRKCNLAAVNRRRAALQQGA